MDGGMKKIEHLGIAVKDLDAAEALFSTLLGKSPYKRETVEREQVSTSFFQTGESKIELLQALSADSAIARFIDKKGEGIHHIAFAVNDIHEEMKRLKAEGKRLIYDEPKRGADQKWVNFIHPADGGGVLIEICQDIDG